MLEAGECLAIRGANACGKSSLLNALCGIIPHYVKAAISGDIILDGSSIMDLPLCEMYRNMAVVLAEPKNQLLLPTVEAELAFALENMAVPAQIIRQRITDAANYFGLSQFMHKSPAQLSGGEQRLLLFAICEAMPSPLVLLDEPERGLSGYSLCLLGSWLEALKQKGRSIIMATHSAELIAQSNQVISIGA